MSSPNREAVAPASPKPAGNATSGAAAKATDTSSTNNTNAATSRAPPLPRVTTPGRDPAALVAKRMQHLQLHHGQQHSSAATMSPLPSNAGVFSAQSPMRTFGNTASAAGTPTRHYALTPVVNNTSMMEEGEQLDFDLDLDLDVLEDRWNSANGTKHANVISPDDMVGGAPRQGGQHLAFPQDLTSSNKFSARPVHPDGPVLPPLAKRGLLPTIAQKSGRSSQKSWNLAPAAHETAATKATAATANSTEVQPILIEKTCSVTRAPELALFPPMEDPVPFPPSGNKGYSFTSMTQYEKRRHLEATAAVPVCTPSPKTKQYQPSRQDQELVFNDIPQDQLNKIFTTRRTGGDDDDDDVDDQSEAGGNPIAFQTALSSTDQEDDDDFFQPIVGGAGGAGAVQQLFQTIPLDDRQFSIPSIRMASRLDGSVASCTTYTDDDESLLMYRDDASLSSRGSFSTLEDFQAAFMVSLSAEQQQSSSFESDDQPLQRESSPAVVVASIESAQPVTVPVMDGNGKGNNHNDAVVLPVGPPISQYHSRRRRQKRKEQRDRKAYDWLRTVKAGTDEVAEAASSKFLTGRKNNQDQERDLALLREERPQKRLSATTAVESRSFAMLQDLAANKNEQVHFGSQDSDMNNHSPNLSMMDVPSYPCV